MRKIILLLLLSWTSFAQQSIPLTDLQAFAQPSTNWSIEGAIRANYTDTSFQVATGKGILLNTLRHGKYQRTDDLTFQLNHGDMRLMMDFMLPKGANSGIYLQGRYEVQLYDSWGKTKLNFGDCGGIYERWDEGRGKGNQGYEGYAPLQNACKAPGTWQTIEIDFQAPRFDASGRKIQNARFKKVILNGILIHENIEVSGMTRGALFDAEAAFGPIRIQGDHGPVAFRNIRYETYDKPSASLGEVKYSYYTGKFTEPIIGQASPVLTGTIPKLTAKVITAKNDYLIRYQAELTIPEADNYEFQTHWTGGGVLKIDGKELNQGAHWYSEKVSQSTFLTAGKHQLELIHIKDFPWGPQALGLIVKRIGSHPVVLHDRKSMIDPEAVGLVEVKANAEPVLQRSFAFHLGKKKTHVIHVGDPSGLHYSYDLKQGAILQVWRGPFLDATQMWHDRGEPQTAEPMGVTVVLDGRFPLTLDHQAQPDSLNPSDLVYKGYRLEQGRPVFLYELVAANMQLEDRIVPAANNIGLTRKINFKSASSMQSALDFVIASPKQIAAVNASLVGLKDQSYFVQTTGGGVDFSMGRQAIQGTNLTYQIIW
jgi:hypothetical protein